MFMAGRRTWQTFHVGSFHLTVEAEPLTGGTAPHWSGLSLERHRNLSDVTRELIDVLEGLRLPATWAVGDPAHSAVTALVASSELPHELALLGDRHWLGPTAGRKRFAHELARRVSQARAAGIHLTTLVPRVASVAEHIDLVVKHGFRAVVGVDNGVPRHCRLVAPQVLHYGVWELSASDRLPQRPTWTPIGNWRLLRSIRRASAEAATIHWVIDAAAVAEQGRSAVKRIAGLLRQTAPLRDRGLLRVETLGGVAARLSELPASTPQRSILRTAA
jgi:hypothetical protein